MDPDHVCICYIQPSSDTFYHTETFSCFVAISQLYHNYFSFILTIGCLVTSSLLLYSTSFISMLYLAIGSESFQPVLCISLTQQVQLPMNTNHKPFFTEHKDSAEIVSVPFQMHRDRGPRGWAGLWQCHPRPSCERCDTKPTRFHLLG